jgi:hypothetical protein
VTRRPIDPDNERENAPEASDADGKSEEDVRRAAEPQAIGAVSNVGTCDREEGQIFDLDLSGFVAEQEKQRAEEEKRKDEKRQWQQDKAKLLRLQIEELERKLADSGSGAGQPAEKPNPRRGRPPGEPKRGDVKKAFKLLQEAVAREREGKPSLPKHSLRAIERTTGLSRYWVTKYRKLVQDE